MREEVTNQHVHVKEVTFKQSKQGSIILLLLLDLELGISPIVLSDLSELLAFGWGFLRFLNEGSVSTSFSGDILIVILP